MNYNKEKGFLRRHIRIFDNFIVSEMEKQAPVFFVTDKGRPFNIPEEIRYKWFLEWKEAQHRIGIKKMQDRSSISYWMQLLYPLVCVILGVIDPTNLGEYLLAAVGGGISMKGLRLASAVKQKTAEYNAISFKNGNEGDKVQVDLKNPAFQPSEEEPEADKGARD